MTGPREPRGIRRSFTISLTVELAQAVHQFMAAEGFSNPNEACRALLLIALASTPTEGAMEAARQRAFNEVRVWFMGEMMKFFEEKKQFLKLASQTMMEIAHS